MPASSSPWSDTSAFPIWRKTASSLESPVRCVRSVNSTASSAVRIRLAAVPSRAARLFAPRPWASGMVVRATAIDPTTATSSAGFPSSIAGTTNSSTIARLRARPTSDSAPRQRANASTTSTNRPARISIGPRRSKSWSVYPVPATASDPGGGSGALATRILSPGSTSGSKPAGVELDLDLLALLGPALDARRGELALLAAEAGAEPLLDLLNPRLLALHGNPLGHLRLHITRPEHHQPSDRRDRQGCGHQGEEADHRA